MLGSFDDGRKWHMMYDDDDCDADDGPYTATNDDGADERLWL